MLSRGTGELERRILLALHDGHASSWVRFLARQEAERAGRTARDAEQALRDLHERGYLALAFGFERGSLTESGLRLAERMAGHAGALRAEAR